MPQSFHSAYSVAQKQALLGNEVNIESGDLISEIELTSAIETHENNENVSNQSNENKELPSNAGFSLCIDVNKKKSFGLAWFRDETAEIEVIARDLILSEDLFELEIVQVQIGVEPAQVFLSSALFDSVADRLRALFPQSHFHFLSPTSFKSESAMMTQFDDLISQFDTSLNPISISCARALFGKCSARSVTVQHIDGFMVVNKTTLDALSIINYEAHPNVHQSRSKQGLSLQYLLNNTVTRMGARHLDVMIRQPLCLKDELNERFDAVDHFLSLPLPVFDEVEQILKRCKDCYFMKSGRLWNAAEWATLFQLAEALVQLKHLHEFHQASTSRIISELYDIDSDQIIETGNLISKTIDFEYCSIERRVVVQHGVSTELDQLKQVYDNLDNILSEKALELKFDLDESLLDAFRLVYFPQLGFLVCFDKPTFETNPGLLDVQEWSMQFTTDISVYFKNSTTRNLDESIGDVHHAIIDAEIEILVGLEDQISPCFTAFEKFIRYIASLDCFMSFAKAARKFDYVRPHFNETGQIILRNARHPLFEHVASTFVKNDAELSEEKRITLLTGPNSSGKSMYLRQVGIICYMAQIGSFVPCSEASLSLVDAIFTRILTRESSSEEISAFMIDCQDMNLALRHATHKSLVLIDEFGKGTVTTDGIGLLLGSINRLSQLQAKAIICTHFHEIFEDDLLQREVDSSSVWLGHMAVLQSEEDSQITFLYKLAEGKCTNSLGCFCAEIAGIPRHVVDRAREIGKSRISGSVLLPNNDDVRARLDNTLTIAEEFRSLSLDNLHSLQSFLESLSKRIRL